ncbi:sperm-associated microtubule inner protein 4 [Trachinotus anak]|uniref:sperm-associated microtubule inner protein 4 n=1 Tax=Trachinotus anak TaxID=443729 RepID=UPI0039F173AF
MLFYLHRQITNQQLYSNAGRKKSKVHLNDQLIPKPTDINIAEKMIKIETPKEHPYSSHISRFAMFPSFRYPDDPETRVRVKSINHYRVISYDNFLQHTKPLKGENQVYPTPPKTVLPNPKHPDWDFSSSERTSNMLKSLERTHWVTSYQMHYPGSRPANPLKIDGFKEKMRAQAGMNSHIVLLRERSGPVFVPSKPKQGCRNRQGSCEGRTACSPSAAEHLNPSMPLKQGTATVIINQHGPQEITAKHNEADLNPKGPSQSENSAGSTEAQSAELSQEASHKQQTHCKCFTHERENSKVQFDESLMQVSMSQSSQKANTAWLADTERPLDLHNRPLSQGEKSLMELRDEQSHKKQYFKVGGNSSSLSLSAVAKNQAGIDLHTELLSRDASEQEKQAEVRGLSHSISNPCILPRPPALPGIHPVDRVATMGRENAALSLLDIQNSFSKSEVHRNFNNSIKRAAVNLRDNVVRGKKHNFYGINCYYLHG